MGLPFDLMIQYMLKIKMFIHFMTKVFVMALKENLTKYFVLYSSKKILEIVRMNKLLLQAITWIN